jgi:hypothetical protein
MVLYHAQAKIVFEKYGIQIPSLDSRKSNTINSLLEDRDLGPRVKDWYISDFPRTIGREDLERAHHPAYVESLYSSNPEKVLFQAYELVDEQGNFHRYNPSSAKPQAKRGVFIP